MKLSEILSKPFKVKGGGTVNLKGLSKHIVDKEVGGSTNMFSSALDSFIKNYPNEYLQDRVANGDNLINIEEITNGYYGLLYKKSFIESLESSARIIYNIEIQSDVFMINTIIKSALNICDEFNIDGEIYCTVDVNLG